ncbi:MAG: hypothetical protein WA154_10335 [Moraxellaceae bacterium]
MNRSSMMQNWWQQIRQFPWLSVGWLTIGAGVLVACFLLWLSLQLAERLTVEVIEPAATAEATVILPDRLEGELGMLFEAVPPLDLNKQIAAVGQRAPEFRGTEFIKTNASNWTLQVMKVSQESVVKTYLSQRTDRQRFQYFRVVEGAQEHYLLTYGNFATVQTAMGALQTMQFDLPSSVKAFPERFSTYQSLVKDQGSEERMSGMAQKIRQILLKPVAAPIEVNPAERAVRTPSTSVQEPAFGALAGDQVAAKTDPAISSPSNAADSSSRPSAPSSATAPQSGSSTPANPPSNPVPIQDPFN